MMGPSDVVYVEKRRGPRWNISVQLMLCGYLSSPGHIERPAIEIGFKVESVMPSDERVVRRI